MTILDRFRLDNRVAIVTGSNRGLGKRCLSHWPKRALKWLS